MSDPNVREIQLGGKQLVFLFMASLVIAVAIFLLGISVGRGVGAPVESATAEPSSSDAEEAPVEMPPPTVTTPGDLRYHDALQGQTPPPPQAQPKEDPKPPAPEPAASDLTSVAVAKPAASTAERAPTAQRAPTAERAPSTVSMPKPTTSPVAGG